MELVITVEDSHLNEVAFHSDGRNRLFNNKCGDNWPSMWK